MNKKYELSGETKEAAGKILHRIKALVDIEKYGVKAGDLGGFIESENNLSRYGNSWVADDAEVYGDAHVSDNALVSGKARVFGAAYVEDDAWVSGNALVYGFSHIYGSAHVYGYATVTDSAMVHNTAKITEYAKICGDAEIYSNAQVSGNARVAGDALIANEGDYATIKFGGHKAITFFNCSDYKARAACGSFYGTIPEFREYVKVMCKDKGVEECLLIADLMEKHFDSNTLDVSKDSDSHEDEEVEY